MRVLDMPIRKSANHPVEGKVTDVYWDGGKTWVVIGDDYEAPLSDYEEIWELTGPPVGPYLRLKR